MGVKEIINKHIDVVKNIPINNNFYEIRDLLIETTEKNKKKILVAGVGKAGHMANIIATSLTSIDIVSINVHPTEIQHGDLGLLQKGDLLVVVSNSGKTREILEFIELSKNKFKETKVICFTNNLDSPIAKNSDYVLNGDCQKEIEPLGLVPTLSLFSFLVLNDILISLVLNKTKYTKYEYGYNHFGGYLGKKTNINEKYLISNINSLDKKNKISGIYSIKNLINNKRYIGQSKNIFRRWNEHLNDIYANKHRNKYLENSFYKYGFENFEFEILEKSEETSLDELEIQYIDRFKTHSEGYNLNKGGNNRENNNKKIIIYDRNGDFVKIYNSIKEVSEKLNIGREDISDILRNKNGRKSLKGHMFRYYTEDYPNKIKPYKNLKYKKIDCFDLNGNFIATFDRIKRAAEILNLDKTSISRCVNGKVKRVGNYTFKKHKL
jgi:arabinose-5-phosphate isomerase